MKYLQIILFLSAFMSAQTRAKVVGIKDGDTITALLDENIQQTLRLAEVDCPESGQPFGKNAKQFTSEQVFGKIIIFYETDQDRYGRTIAKVYYDSGKYLSEEIIKSGLGWWYHQYSNNALLDILQDEAKSQRIGLWQDNNPTSPYEWRKSKRTNNFNEK